MAAWRFVFLFFWLGSAEDEREKRRNKQTNKRTNERTNEQTKYSPGELNFGTLLLRKEATRASTGPTTRSTSTAFAAVHNPATTASTREDPDRFALMADRSAPAITTRLAMNGAKCGAMKLLRAELELGAMTFRAVPARDNSRNGGCSSARMSFLARVLSFFFVLNAIGRTSRIRGRNRALHLSCRRLWTSALVSIPERRSVSTCSGERTTHTWLM